MFKKTYEIEGYVAEGGCIFCSDCAPAEVQLHGFPIFTSSEWDYAPACEKCGEVLDVVVLKVTRKEVK